MAHYPLPSAVQGAAPSYSPPAAPPPTYFDVQDRTLAECNQRLDELKETNRKLSVMVESFAADNVRKSQELLEQQHDAPKPADAAGPATAKPAAGFFGNLFGSSKKGGRRTRKRRKNTKKRGGGAGASRMKHTSPPPRQLSQIPHVIPRGHTETSSPERESADLQDLSEQLEDIATPNDSQQMPDDWHDLGATVRPTIPADTAVTRALERVRARQKEVQDFLDDPDSPAARARSPLINEGPDNVAKLQELRSAAARARTSPMIPAAPPSDRHTQYAVAEEVREGKGHGAAKAKKGGRRTRKRRRQRWTRKQHVKRPRKQRGKGTGASRPARTTRRQNPSNPPTAATLGTVLTALDRRTGSSNATRHIRRSVEPTLQAAEAARIAAETAARAADRARRVARVTKKYHEQERDYPISELYLHEGGDTDDEIDGWLAENPDETW